jgi:hypothetical protein
MDENQVEQNRKIQEFLNREFDWRFSAGECHFLIQLLAHLVQENPSLVINPKGEAEKLNYQSIRTIVLLNEKLSSQLQVRSRESSINMGEVQNQRERVQ